MIKFQIEKCEMKKILFLPIILSTLSCTNKDQNLSISKNAITKEVSAQQDVIINKDKNTMKERLVPPKGYTWMDEKPDSFGYFIENFKLKPYGAQILKYDGTPIATQNLHEAIFDIDTGNQDLQQCADALIRLRAEYLFKQKKFDEIKFHFTSGHLSTWKDYKNGMRAIVKGNSVAFKKTAKPDDSYENFKNYLNVIFYYSGTISLHQESKTVTSTQDLKTGDFLITPGSPGHVVFISGVCENQNGERLFLLSEGFTPAQSIHLLSNPYEKNISPWYYLDVKSLTINTARYIFKGADFKKF